jgi:hypothetical protein
MSGAPCAPFFINYLMPFVFVSCFAQPFPLCLTYTLASVYTFFIPMYYVYTFREGTRRKPKMDASSSSQTTSGATTGPDNDDQLHPLDQRAVELMSSLQGPEVASEFLFPDQWYRGSGTHVDRHNWEPPALWKTKQHNTCYAEKQRRQVRPMCLILRAIKACKARGITPQQTLQELHQSRGVGHTLWWDKLEQQQNKEKLLPSLRCSFVQVEQPWSSCSLEDFVEGFHARCHALAAEDEQQSFRPWKAAYSLLEYSEPATGKDGKLLESFASIRRFSKFHDERLTVVVDTYNGMCIGKSERERIEAGRHGNAGGAKGREVSSSHTTLSLTLTLLPITPSLLYGRSASSPQRRCYIW